MHTLYLMLNHIVNLFLPAVFVALGMALLAKPIVARKSVKTYSIRQHLHRNFWCGCIATVTGLLIFGQDSKMLSYALMIVLIALVECCYLYRYERQLD